MAHKLVLYMRGLV